MKFRTVAVGLTAAVVVVVFTVGALTWWVRSSGPAVRVVSEEGGVSVAVPQGWQVDKIHPTDPARQEFLNGRERAALGLLQRGGFWVARWAANADTTSESIKARMRKDQRQAGRGKWSIDDGVVAGHTAVVMRYEHPPESLEFLGFGDVRTTVRELLINGFIYQVGTWTLPHAGNVPQRLEEIAQSLEVFAPRPWRADHVTLPGGWVEHETELPGATFFAISPGNPNHAWMYVFRYDTAPTTTLNNARTNIVNSGGELIAQRDDRLGGREAVRLDFTFPDGDDRPPARDVEWFASDGQGGTFVLAVGRRSGDETIAEQLAATWRF